MEIRRLQPFYLPYLLANILGISSLKQDLDGSRVRQVYNDENDLYRIINYCELDVVTTAQVFLKFRGDPLLDGMTSRKFNPEFRP